MVCKKIVHNNGSWAKVFNADCFDVFPAIKDQSIDLILTDLPYGTTKNKWDSILPLDKLWFQYNRIIKDSGSIVLTCTQPFTSFLVISNLDMFKYMWVWEKSAPANIGCANIQPLKYHEDIAVFYKKQPIYNKQMIDRDELGKKRLQNKNNPIRFSGSDNQDNKDVKKNYDINRYDEDKKNPSTIIKVKSERSKLHPTQKPTELMEYMIKTYTDEGMSVLDNCMGSGTTGLACKNLNRNFIGIEKEQNYYDIAVQRIETE